MDARATHWIDILALAYGVMRLPPDVFWAMTPREFDAAARPFLPAPAATTGRTELDALMRAHPDNA